MDILPASILDLGPLQQIERTCFDKDRWPLLDLMAVLTFPDVVRLKAVVDGHMVGFVAGDQRDSSGFSWIATIAVLPEYQRQGIGRALLHACEAKLMTARVRLCVRTENGGAIRLYEQEAYERVDIWRGYYKDHADALVMEKLLGNGESGSRNL
jgi:ribosomal protein S18 acetylase RimI-like enzyme